MTTNPKVILYSVTRHVWEVWQTGRPLGEGSLESCREAYPSAPPPTQRQLDLAANDPKGQNEPYIEGFPNGDGHDHTCAGPDCGATIGQAEPMVFADGDPWHAACWDNDTPG